MTASISAESISPIHHNQIPVITTELLAQLYGTTAHSITKNHRSNVGRFVVGKHYFKVEGKELATLRITFGDLQISPKTRSLILWTERGAARHAKMLETDQAWEVFEKLEDNYFNQHPVEQHTTTDDRTPLRDAVNMLIGKKGMMYPDAYNMIHQRFAVSHIEQLTQAQMLEAIEYIHCLLLNETRLTIPDLSFVITLKNGQVSKMRPVHKGEHLMTFDAFKEIAERAGYLVIHSDNLRSMTLDKLMVMGQKKSAVLQVEF
ncbi:ORF6N domain-containing protein [Salmonella enterica subsp. enterica serovar Aba]|nr:ORF6N domain-containing protein [Salmonella enterica subsp. enterica serovar Aba]ECG5317612.1 ORF6N domain-containing protein [Salmonella enterica subsp. enterica serovar Aba]